MTPEDDRYRVFPQFADPAFGQYARTRHRLGGAAEVLFPGDTRDHRIVRALAHHRALSLKEILETFELFHRVRRRIRRSVVADLCCGHGLTGVLFALRERSVERVLLVDQRRPTAVDRVLAAAADIAPWVADKVTFVEDDIERVTLPPGAGSVAVHACGRNTDRALDVALRTGGPVAVMPCCHTSSRRHGIAGLREALGTRLAVDVDRTYRMEAAGLRVQWTAIPAAITPMNRVMIGVPRDERRADETVRGPPAGPGRG